LGVGTRGDIAVRFLGRELVDLERARWNLTTIVREGRRAS
jgi:hypothetical protein